MLFKGNQLPEMVLKEACGLKLVILGHLQLSSYRISAVMESPQMTNFSDGDMF